MAAVTQLFRQAGFQALLATDGEALTFRSTSIAAIVDRNPALSPADLAELELSVLDGSRIELLKTAVASVPVRGEVFTDAGGVRHRVALVRSTDITYRVVCILG